ncbi:MAG: aryl-sulfate sulfotransferase [Proteobacteria bacterium]|nr:aryl-sulfate sulfotransferase [Pseudomonadota bacterium]
MNNARLLVLTALAATLLLSSDIASALQFSKPPQIAKNPNERVPLAAILSFEVEKPVKTEIQVDDGSRKWTLNFPMSSNAHVTLPIVGMKAGTTHRFEVTAIDAAGERVAHPEQLIYTTPALPGDGIEFPIIRVNRAEVNQMEPGVTLLTVRRMPLGRPDRQTKLQREFSEKFGMIIAVNTAGEVVWYYKFDARIAGIASLNNGNIFFHTLLNQSVEIDLLGNTIRQWGAALGSRPLPKGVIPVQAVTLHHTPDELPNGNFLALQAFPRQIDNYYTSEYDQAAPRKTQTVIGDEIIEFTPEGKVVWRWNAFDYLDPFKIGYETFSPYWWVRGFPGALGWTHGNGVYYDKRDDSVLVSFRKLDAVLKIDKKSKEIKWILARDVGWSPELRKKLLKPIGDNFQYFHHQHNPRVTPDGNLIVFNNNVFQAIPFTGEKVKSPEESLSNAIVYEVDAARMTAKVVFSTPKDPESGCYVWATGDAHMLPKTGNILVDFAMCYPGHKVETFNDFDRTKVHPMDLPWTPRIMEYRKDTSGQAVFDMQLVPRGDLMKWDVFGLIRIPSLYPSR